MFRRITGTKDVLPEEVSRWQNLEAISRNVFAIYNYREIRPPLIEEEALFNRSLGESTEIVQKQMFLIKKGAGFYALRPEATASVARAYIENSLNKAASFSKLYYIGPMFRLERPQKGRLRQFHHIGCEAIGSREAGIDIEIIALADDLLKAFSIEGYKIKINSLGCLEDKKKLTEVLRKGLKGKFAGLCVDCKKRFKNNPLRILDCKNQRCIEIVSEVALERYLCPECNLHFAKVKEGLDYLKINYEVSYNLVRGLDYYTRTVFEITHKDLGSQDALGAGGRYDFLIRELGGPDVGAMGFAFGVERLLLAVRPLSNPAAGKGIVYVISLGDSAEKEGLKLLDTLRKTGIPSDTDYENKSLKGALRRANDLQARYVLIIGEDELKKKVVTLKDMVSGEQKEVKPEDLIKELTLTC